jgi:hypothetical protein
LDDGGWERLKQRAQWDRLNVSEARALRLLNFIAFDFSDPSKAALEALAEDGRLAAYVDEYKSIVVKEWRLHHRKMRLRLMTLLPVRSTCCS